MEKGRGSTGEDNVCPSAQA